MKKRIELIIRVNKEAGSEEFYNKSQELGMLALRSFKGERESDKQERHRSQMTGLENIAETTLKVTDVLDYIKKQTAHQKGEQGWKKKVGANGELFGEVLQKCVESDLKAFVDNVCNSFIDSTSEEGKQERQEVYLLLIRQLIRQLVVQFEYESLVEESTKP